MHLHKIELLHFKNHEKWVENFCSGVNCITGRNGSGKTNILDAIYLLSFCKSNFQSIDKNICFNHSDFYSVKGEYISNEIDFEVSCKYQEGKRKIVKFNNNAYKKLSEHIGVIPLVMITPLDIQLINEASEERRRLIDSTIGQVDHIYLNKLTEYYKILEHRNKLLKEYSQNQAVVLSQVDIWNKQLVDRGNYIYKARKKHLQKISLFVSDIYEILSSKRENITIEYISKLNTESFEQLIENNFKKDIVLERTTEGIHKDDLEFCMNGQMIKKYGSQGQQKTFIFALKLAIHQYLTEVIQKKPLLLLDDLFEKLDESRSEELMLYISTYIHAQVFITDTHHERAKNILSRMNAETKFIQL